MVDQLVFAYKEMLGDGAPRWKLDEAGRDMGPEEIGSDSELLAAISEYLGNLPVSAGMPREAKWRTTEQLANEIELFGRDAVNRLDRVLREHEARCLERLTNGLPSDALIRRAKYPDRTTALPLWGSVRHHGQPWPENRPDRSDPPDDVPSNLYVSNDVPHVFLSHTHRDGDLTLRVAEALAKMGIGSWRFETHIDQRGDIADCVREALSQTAGLVALVTRKSIASLWVFTELSTCLEFGRTIVMVVDADDELLIELLQSVRFSHPDKPFESSVEYRVDLVDRLKSDYALHESAARTERYGPQVRDFLASLPIYLGSVSPGSSRRVWQSALAFPEVPARWSGCIKLGHLRELPSRLITTR